MIVKNIGKYGATPAFKGYDAVPLKALHIDARRGKVEDELREIAKKEDFEIKSSIYNESYNQDLKVILQKHGAPCLIMQGNEEFDRPHLPDISKQYDMPLKHLPMFDSSTGFVSGGNFFMGKTPKGKKWMLIGAMNSNMDKDKISKLYDVEKENIHFITQQDYHLDFSIRPIGYPYVLINHPGRARKNMEEVTGKEIEKTKIDEMLMESYKKTIIELRQAGFYPIPVCGVYPEGINFLNAVVNLHDDGSISYITNSSDCDDDVKIEYQKKFEKELKEKLEKLSEKMPDAPKLRDIYFVKGEVYEDIGWNEMMDNIVEGSGGIHCMSLEEPNFDVWG